MNKAKQDKKKSKRSNLPKPQFAQYARPNFSELSAKDAYQLALDHKDFEDCPYFDQLAYIIVHGSSAECALIWAINISSHLPIMLNVIVEDKSKFRYLLDWIELVKFDVNRVANIILNSGDFYAIVSLYQHLGVFYNEVRQVVLEELDHLVLNKNTISMDSIFLRFRTCLRLLQETGKQQFDSELAERMLDLLAEFDLANNTVKNEFSQLFSVFWFFGGESFKLSSSNQIVRKFFAVVFDSGIQLTELVEDIANDYLYLLLNGRYRFTTSGLANVGKVIEKFYNDFVEYIPNNHRMSIVL